MNLRASQRVNQQVEILPSLSFELLLRFLAPLPSMIDHGLKVQSNHSSLPKLLGVMLFVTTEGPRTMQISHFIHSQPFTEFVLF